MNFLLSSGDIIYSCSQRTLNVFLENIFFYFVGGSNFHSWHHFNQVKCPGFQTCECKKSVAVLSTNGNKNEGGDNHPSSFTIKQGSWVSVTSFPLRRGKVTLCGNSLSGAPHLTSHLSHQKEQDPEVGRSQHHLLWPGKLKLFLHVNGTLKIKFRQYPTSLPIPKSC